MNHTDEASTRKEQKAHTRSHILSVSKTLFEMQGFRQTTSRQIAKEAGIAAGTLFVHFPSKESILATVLYESIEEVLQSAFSTLPEENFADKLLHLARALYTFYAQRPKLSRVLLQHNIFADGTNVEFDQQSDDFRLWIAEGALRNEVVATPKDAEIAAHSFMAQYLYVLREMLKQDEPDVPGALAQLKALVEWTFR